MSFVQVYWAKDEMEASLIKGFLENVEIKTIISPLNYPLNSDFPIAAMPELINLARTPHGIYVKNEDAEEAKKVLAERR